MIESKLEMDRFGDNVGVSKHETEDVEREGFLAISLIEKWGMVAGQPEGEDSAGRSITRLQTPEELIDRAFTVAELAFARLREKGLIHQLPTIKEINDANIEHKKKKDDARGINN